MKAWWNNRAENEQAWKVGIDTLKGNGFNLDIKNPFVKEEEVTHTTTELLDLLSESFKKSDELLSELKSSLQY